MFDTVIAAWHQRDAKTYDFAGHSVGLDAAVDWTNLQLNPGTGGLKAAFNPTGMQFTRVVNAAKNLDEYRAQFNLTKLLFGNNCRELGRDDVMPALSLADDLLHTYFPDAPRISDMTARRIDATADRVLTDERDVALVLRRMRDYRLRNRAPVVGQDGTITWGSGSGGYQRKMYSKYRESGLEEGLGRLRVEVGAIGQKPLKESYEKAIQAAVAAGHLSMPSGSLAVGPALTCPGLSEAIVGSFAAIADTMGKEGDAVKIDEAYDRLRATGLKPSRCYNVLGAMMCAKVRGWENAGISRTSIYEVRKQMAAAGVSPEQLELEGLTIKFTDVAVACHQAVERRGRKKKVVAGAAASPAGA